MTVRAEIGRKQVAMRPFTERKTAIAAAHVLARTNVKNPISLRRLANFTSQHDIFNHDAEDDWDKQEKRRAVERENDPIHTNTSFNAALEQQRHNKRVDAITATVERENPEIGIKRRMAAANVKDAASIDYKDPTRKFRTKLHDAVLDNNYKEVERLLSLGADPYVPDGNSLTPLGLAQFEGHHACIKLLKEAMQKIPPLQNTKSA